MLRVVPKLLLGRLRGRSLSRTLTPSDLKHAAMAVPPSTGELLYLAARTIGARSVVEFGTSFGMSAIYLASAVKDNGGGTVIG
ncbi:MAG: O-methyltransferase, partial [Burkholderiales bacterium]